LRVLVSSLASHIDTSFKILDDALSSAKSLYIAYSGGKDSTALSILVYDWIVSRKRYDLDVVLVHSDTLSEIPEMESWARGFMEDYVVKLRRLGIHADYRVVAPTATETFYWRVFVRGYPAPTYSFRWCVYLLKRRPAREALEGAELILLGHRDDESSIRVRMLKSRTGCPLRAGACSSYYFSVEGNARKIYPIRSWSEADVWKYLRSKVSEFDLKQLFVLYGYGAAKARYGCWHCTLVKYQLGHLILEGGHMFYEAVRLLYRWLSDIPELRERKEKGYSRLGALKVSARSLIMNSMLIAEKLSGIRLYGLDESKVSGYSLREILFELPENEAEKLILEEDKKARGDPRRIPKISELRNIDMHKRDLEQYTPSILTKAQQRGVHTYLDKILSYIF